MLQRHRTELFLVLAGLVLFVPGLGAVHLFDWDEINFAEIAREMIATGEYLRPQVNYQPFWEKPPLFSWMQVLTMQAFGVGEFAARLPNALCGLLTLVLLHRMGTRLHDSTFGLLWALAYLGSVLPHLYFRSGIIDPWFNLFIFLAIHQFILGRWAQRDVPGMVLHSPWRRHALGSGLFLGLATLTKGPTAILIAGLTAGIWLIRQRFRGFVDVKFLALVALATAGASFLWFGIETWKNGPWFLTEFVTYQYRLFSTPDAGHAGFPGYHFVVLLIGCFPASLFMIPELLRPTRGNAQQQDHRLWMVILFWVVLLLFTIVKSKIVHYSSMCYFPLTYLAALHLRRLWLGEVRAGLGLRIGLGVVGGLFALITLVLPYLGMHVELILPLFSQDPFARANMEAQVGWTGWEALAGVWMLAVLVIGLQALRKAEARKGIRVLFGGTAIFIFLTLYFFIGRIEGYSQRAAINFYKESQGEPSYVITRNFRSYAHLFYTRITPPGDPRAYDQEWLLHGEIDRPVYVVCKETSAAEVDSIATLNKLGHRNGFHFYKRELPAP